MSGRYAVRGRCMKHMVPLDLEGNCYRCNADQSLCLAGLDSTTETETFGQLVRSSAVKDTNPKDAIGIRKSPLSVVPMGVVVEMGVGMLEGTCKYGRHNYRGAGVRSSVYFDATMRHLIAYWEGEDLDPDSGMSHLTKALCSLAVWRDAQMQGMCTDDRPPRSAPFYPEMNRMAGEILDRHKDKSPKHWTIQDTRGVLMPEAV
jgi:hypothetical protein